MFIGHFGAGFAGKKFENTASLGIYFMAAQWIDLIWPILLLLGIEKAEIKPGVTSVTPLDFTYYPFTHSLFGVIGLIRTERQSKFFLGCRGRTVTEPL